MDCRVNERLSIANEFLHNNTYYTSYLGFRWLEGSGTRWSNLRKVVSPFLPSNRKRAETSPQRWSSR